ncbi:MAG TPA: winged helix-turn-helix domain-containing protein [Micromonosporaceae bacterium]|nr:winged helix-turn-helix domain-containing protein [Micromonosporaceae bacterium]
MVELGVQQGAPLTTRPPWSRRIADEITDLITSGRWRPGRQLPSTSRLAEQYGVSEATAYRAVRELHRRGLVVGERGRGVYVADPTHPIG